MSLLEGVFLGILQGLTEFIPVSSSGHLVLAQYYFGILELGITLEIMLHFGTLFSVIWVFHKDLLKIISGFITDKKQQHLIFLLICGTVPTGIIGVFFSSFFRKFYESPLAVALMLLITGIILWFLTILPEGSKSGRQIKWYDAFLIGVFQGLAIIPGISRSGITITGAIWRKLEREAAVKFSFLLSLPAILGASIWELIDIYQAGAQSNFNTVYILSALAAFVSGVLAIKFFIKMLSKGKFYYFSYYCWLIGSLVLIAEFLG